MSWFPKLRYLGHARIDLDEVPSDCNELEASDFLRIAMSLRLATTEVVDHCFYATTEVVVHCLYALMMLSLKLLSTASMLSEKH